MPGLKATLGKREWIGRSLLVGWAVLTIVVLALLGIAHSASLPRPRDEAHLADALLKLRRHSGGKFLVHVIYSECSCSRTLLTHLVRRQALPGNEELILFIGSGNTQLELAKRSGFECVTISATQLVTRFGLEAAPVLVILDSAGRLRYAGGYYDNPATITPLDEKIFRELGSRSTIEPLPVFGCAVSAGLQKALDPLRVEYSK